MIVGMAKGASQESVDNVISRAESLGLAVQLNIGTDRTVVAILLFIILFVGVFHYIVPKRII